MAGRGVTTLGLSILLAACADRDTSVVPAAVIFGTDDRIELYETDEVRRELFARAVPAMIRESALRTAADGRVTFVSSPFGPSRGLCAGEAHYDQPTAPSCSGTLIDDDLVLTAGHCVDAVDCASMRWVFGWYYDSAGVLHTRTTDDVFSCAEIVAYASPSGDNDFAIVRLDRAPPGPPAEVRLGPVTLGETTSLAGYPFGLPMKVVEMGPVTRVRGDLFYARLDAHPGNSGSGVFDAELRVIGELTNGPVGPFVDTGSCLTLAAISDDTTNTETIRTVDSAVARLCASGYPSERLCGFTCGDGDCESGEDCPADCGTDAGPPAPDAGRPDAGRAVDAGLVATPDAAIDTRVPAGGGCTCRTHAATTGSLPMLLVVGLALVLARRR